MLAEWSDVGLRRLAWESDGFVPSLRKKLHNCHSEWQCLLDNLLSDYQRSNWNAAMAIQIDVQGLPAFTCNILLACRKIAFGSLKTYGELASEAGRPAAARGVGQAMAKNPIPIIVPCHRVVGARGALTGYSGAGGIETKRRLLLQEGLTNV